MGFEFNCYYSHKLHLLYSGGQAGRDLGIGAVWQHTEHALIDLFAEYCWFLPGIYCPQSVLTLHSTSIEGGWFHSNTGWTVAAGVFSPRALSHLWAAVRWGLRTQCPNSLHSSIAKAPGSHFLGFLPAATWMKKDRNPQQNCLWWPLRLRAWPWIIPYLHFTLPLERWDGQDTQSKRGWSLHKNIQKKMLSHLSSPPLHKLCDDITYSFPRIKRKPYNLFFSCFKMLFCQNASQADKVSAT